MPRPKSKSAKPKPAADSEPNVKAYRYRTKRKNIPPAGLAAQGKVREAPKIKFEYNPHLPPVLRFDATGAADKLPELLQAARTRPLTKEEAQTLTDALRVREPWLEWAGKREKKGFEVDPVALHIHERIAAQVIMQTAARESIQRSFFADPELSYREAIQFYQYDMDWANRMILGDSLQVMASLAYREGMAGKVQMIYVDPPYGINFRSNFQSEIGKRDVKDKETDLTREPEMVKAYRDTWTLGIHSYLAYLRDRLILATQLLTDSGSIFVQISDENLHRVRALMDEIFGVGNFCGQIQFKKTGYAASDRLATICDYLLWYCKDIGQVYANTLFEQRNLEAKDTAFFDRVELPTGERRPLTKDEQQNPEFVPTNCRILARNPLVSPDYMESLSQPIEFEEERFPCPPNAHWKTTPQGIQRLIHAERIAKKGNTIRMVRYFEDYSLTTPTNTWMDLGSGGFVGDQKQYVVQTDSRVIQRCLFLTTKPGDLVLDPTCGSGTTAYVAELWGRRWITIDTSRVALALARQRLLTATFPLYKVKTTNGSGNGENPAQGFIYKPVPHITLKSIAQNAALDVIFAKHQPTLDGKLVALNVALTSVTPTLRNRLAAKLTAKERRGGKKSITDADRRRWLLPKSKWKEWEVPFDSDEDWPPELKNVLTEYRAAWRAKMDEVNAAITANAEPEELVDKPQEEKGVVRVSGPFTMEAVMPLEESLETESPIAGTPEEMETFPPSATEARGLEPTNAEAYLDKMLRLLRADGVRFPNNKVLKFTRLDPYSGDFLHAEGEWESEDGKVHKVTVSFGPEFGPVTVYQVERALRQAARRGFDDLVIAGFSFDAEAQATIDEDPNPDVRCHLAHIRPDVNMGDLLKETPDSQIFTVFGSPRTELHATKEGEFYVELQGVDIYNPVDNTILPTSAEKVAAWFLDSDYDGRTFCITQAFFPDKTAWDKLARALKGVVDEDRFAAFSGTTSLPFPPGKHKRAAVKVIDPRGNEVMRVHRLEDEAVRYDKR